MFELYENAKEIISFAILSEFYLIKHTLIIKLFHIMKNLKNQIWYVLTAFLMTAFIYSCGQNASTDNTQTEAPATETSTNVESATPATDTMQADSSKSEQNPPAVRR